MLLLSTGNAGVRESRPKVRLWLAAGDALNAREVWFSAVSTFGSLNFNHSIPLPSCFHPDSHALSHALSWLCAFGWPESGGATSVGCDVQSQIAWSKAGGPPGPPGPPASVTSRGSEIFEIGADEVPAVAWSKYVKVTVVRAKMSKNGNHGTALTVVFNKNRWTYIPVCTAQGGGGSFKASKL